MLLFSYLFYMQTVVEQLRREALNSGRMYARVFEALADSADDADATLLDLAQHVREMGVPVIVTDVDGRPTASANLPFEARLSSRRLREYVSVLDRQNAPVVEPGVGTVHYGHTGVVRGLRVVPLFQALLLALLAGTAVYVLRTRSRADRERLWSGMARETAHQLGTPLSSLAGWIELLKEQVSDPMAATAVAHMSGDLERLDHVAHRFERIGRPPRRDEVDLGALAERVAAYFRARVPTLAHTVRVTSEARDGPHRVLGDAVLLEWAVEVLLKNAVDALAGRGGLIQVVTSREANGPVRLRIEDDGPGVAPELRGRVFDAGFTTKERGWGIGLALAKRIVTEGHGGTLRLARSESGAAFEIILPAC